MIGNWKVKFKNYLLFDGKTVIVLLNNYTRCFAVARKSKNGDYFFTDQYDNVLPAIAWRSNKPNGCKLSVQILKKIPYGQYIIEREDCTTTAILKKEKRQNEDDYFYIKDDFGNCCAIYIDPYKDEPFCKHMRFVCFVFSIPMDSTNTSSVNLYIKSVYKKELNS